MTEKTDIDLIEKIHESLQLIKGGEQLVDILTDYLEEGNPNTAYHQVADYLETTLLESIELSETGAEQQKDTTHYSYWVNIEDYDFLVKDLKSIRRAEVWDEERSRVCFIIKINETSENSFPLTHANTVIKFFSKESRDEVYKRVKRRLCAFTFIRFL